jgi:hypothetical protein
MEFSEMLKRTLCVLIVVAAVFALAATATAKKTVAGYTADVDALSSRSPVVLYFDDMEGGTAGWTSVDNTATAATHFHLDTYMAYEGTYSWWCGTFDYDTDGGYGNSWDDRLTIPTLDLSGATYPILTYAFRHDSETGYDYTYVQAESLGVYVDLNRGYDGTQPWTDIGLYGFILQTYDNPLNARFRFLSDGAWSDEDGLYASVGGGFACDMVKVFDYYGGYVYFYDDGESGGLCVPGIPATSGDFWHIIDRCCPAYSDPHSWWCGDDADTTLIPANLNNSLISPAISIVGSATCTLRFLLHAEVPTVDNDYWTEHVSVDGGGTWVQTGAWWGDFGQCDGWGTSGIGGTDISLLLPGTMFQFKLTFYSTDNGCGPGAAGGAGIMLDDTWLEDWTGSAVEETSWGSIKAMYR